MKKLLIAIVILAVVAFVSQHLIWKKALETRENEWKQHLVNNGLAVWSINTNGQVQWQLKEGK